MRYFTQLKDKTRAILHKAALSIAAMAVTATTSLAASWNGTAVAPASGTGTSADPYIISTAEELAYISQRAGAGDYSSVKVYVKLDNDIELNDALLDGNGDVANPTPHSWVPIGSATNPVIIDFDGNGHSISSLYVSGSDNNVGLFGVVADGSSISNVIINDSYVSGGDNVGGVVGATAAGATLTMSGVLYAGTVTGDSNVGGLAGNVKANISGSTGRASVSATTDNAGGIAGQITGGSITTSVNRGSINAYAAQNVGGVAGSALGTAITYNVNYGEVSGTSVVGGLVGHADVATTASSEIAGNVNNGAVFGTTVGGIVGKVHNSIGSHTNNVEGNVNFGSVEGSSVQGGIVGAVPSDNTGVTIAQNLNNGKVTGPGNGSVVGTAVSTTGISANYYDEQLLATASGAIGGTDVAGAAEAATTGDLVSGSKFSTTYLTQTAGLYPLPASAPIDDIVRANAAAIVLSTSGAEPETVDLIKSDFTVPTAPGYTWSDSEGILTFNADGTVNITGSGETTISVTYGTYTRSFKVGINYVATCVVTLVDYDEAFYTYRGVPIAPEVASVKVGLTTIDPSDYAVSYTANNAVGEATVKVTLTGGISGSGQTTFNIIDAPEVSYTVSIDASEQSFVYNGCDQHPTNIKVVVIPTMLTTAWPEAVGHEVTLSKDYTVTVGTTPVSYTNSYSIDYPAGGSTDASDEPYTLYVRAASRNLVLASYTDGSGTHTKEFHLVAGDEQSATYEITTRPLAVNDNFKYTLSEEEYTYNGEDHEPEVTVQMKDCNGDWVTLSSAGDYTVSVAEDRSTPGTKHLTIEGTGNYSGSVEKTYVVEAANIADVTFTLDYDMTYSGSEKKPTVADATDNNTGNGLSTSDYRITGYEDNVNAGTGKVLIEGRGNYSGTTEVEFEIEKADIGDATITFTPALTFNGQEQHPTTTNAIYNGKSVAASEYTVTWPAESTTGGNKNATITANEVNFTGNTTEKYTIGKLGWPGAVTFEDIADQEYAGGTQIKPVPVVKIGDIVIDNSYFTITYGTNKNVGQGTVNVKPKSSSNFTSISPKTLYFNIVGRSITGGTVTLNDAGAGSTYTYTGAEIEPNITVVAPGDVTLTAADYTVSYTGSQINVGDVHMTITGRGNYTGTIETDFHIVAAALSSCTFDPLGSVTYNGLAQNPSTPPSITLGAYTLREDVDYTVEYSNNINAGSALATYTAVAGGNFSGTATQNYTINKVSLTETSVSVQGLNPEYSYTGQDITPEPTIKYRTLTLTKDDGQFTFSYANNKEIGTNTATITITATAGGNFADAITRTFSIVPVNIANATFSPSTIAAQEYTSLEIKPAVTLTYNFTSGVRTLVEGTDYDITYTNNVNAGRATMTFVGKGAFAGSSVDKEFTINAVDLSSSPNVTATLAETEYDYTGAEIQPVPTVKLGGVTLTEGTDYTLEYEHNVNYGTATVTVRAKSANFANSKDLYFTINKINLSSCDVAFAGGTFVYNGTDFEPAVSVTIGGEAISTDQYHVTYSDNRDAGEATVSILPTANSNFTGSKVVHFTIDRCPLNTLTARNIASQEYTGSAIEPAIEIEATVNGSTVVLNADCFDASYEDNVDAGTAAKAIATGKGNYTGTLTKTFTITPVDLATSTFVAIDDIPSKQYTGNNIELDAEAVIRLRGNALTKDVDYTLSYANNKNVGTATVTFTAKSGNFVNSRSTTFEITKVPLGNATVTGVDATYVYNGTAINPTPVLHMGETLIPASEYTYSITNNTQPGLATITFTAADRADCIYTGTFDYHFTITAVDLKDAYLKDQSTIPSSVFMYAEIKPTPRVAIRYEGAEHILTAGVDFEYYYENNVNVGDAAVVRIIAKSDTYMGTKDFNFSITKKCLTNNGGAGAVTFENPNKSMSYTGIAVEQDSYILTYNGKHLAEGVDFNVSYVNNTGVGTATVTYTGIGNFECSKQYNFTISRATIADAVVTLPDLYYFSGYAIKPEPVVVYNGMTLTKDVDYTLDNWKNNTNPTQSATFRVNGKGVYSGNQTVTFEILKPDLNDRILFKAADGNYYAVSENNPTAPTTTVYKPIEDYYYTGVINRPSVNTYVKVGDNYQQLNYNSNHNAYDTRQTWTYNISSGTGYMFINSVDGTYFINAGKVPFTIHPVDFQSNKTTVELTKTSYEYTGRPILATVKSIKNNGSIVYVNATDTMMTYVNNIEPGTATLTIQGQDNTRDFVNVGTYTFTITKTQISKATITNLSEVSATVAPILNFNGTIVDPSEYTYKVRTNDIQITALASSPHFTAGTVSFSRNPINIAETVVATNTTTESNSAPFTDNIDPTTSCGTVTYGAVQRERYGFLNLGVRYYRTGTAICTKIVEHREGVETTTTETTTTTTTTPTATVSGTYYYTGAAIEPGTNKANITISVVTTVETEVKTTVSKTGTKIVENQIQNVTYKRYCNEAGTQWVADPDGDNYDKPVGYENIDASTVTGPYDETQESTTTTTPTSTTKTLAQGDFKVVSHEDNINATVYEGSTEKAKIYVAGIGNYTGMAIVPFDINPLDFSDIWAWSLNPFTAGAQSANSRGTGHGMKDNDFVIYDFFKEKPGRGLFFSGDYTNHPSFSLRFGRTNTQLLGTGYFHADKARVRDAAGTDFIYYYSNCESCTGNTSTATITIEASPDNHNFIGQTSINYTLTHGRLSYNLIHVDPKDYEWTGFPICLDAPEVRIADDVANLPVNREYYALFYMQDSKVVTKPTNVGTYFVGAYSVTNSIYGTLKTPGSLVDGVAVSAALFNQNGNDGAIWGGKGIDFYNIVPIDKTKIDIAPIPDQTFNWLRIAAEPTLTYTSTDSEGNERTYTFVPGTDFTYVQSSSGVQTAGEDELIITLNTAAPGEKLTAKFNIVPADLQTVYDAGKLRVTIPVQTYDGTEKKPVPEIIFVDPNGGEHSLIGGSADDTENVSLEWSDNIATGTNTAKVKITGNGKRFTGELTVPFSIGKADFSRCVAKNTESMKVQWSCAGLVMPTVELKDPVTDVDVASTEYTVLTTSLGDVPVGETSYIELEAKSTSNYTGRCRVPVSVTNLTITQSNPNVKVHFLEPASFFYYDGGKPIKPTFEVRYYYNGPDNPEYCLLNAGECYALADGSGPVTYANNTIAGEASVTINFAGNCSGAYTATFQIQSVDLENPLRGTVYADPVASAEFTGQAVTPSSDPVLHYIDYYDVDHVLVENVDYVLEYSNNVNAGVNTAVVNFHGLGKNYSGNHEENFTIEKANIAAAEQTKVLTDMTYTGSEIKPEPNLLYGTYHLTKGTDYKVEWENNVEVGTATIKVTALDGGNFYGTASYTFNIVGMELTVSRISSIANQTCTGSAITPSFTVYYEIEGVERELRAGVDYDYEYLNNTAVGTATVLITAKGNFKGTARQTFRIVAKNIGNITWDPIDDQPYDEGNPVTPTTKIYYEGVELTKDVDYTITYQNNYAPGTARMIVTAKRGTCYSGSKSIEFTIEQAEITLDAMADIPYTGDFQAPAPVVRSNGAVVPASTSNYTVSYDPRNVLNVGEYTCTVTGKGTYVGTVSTTFNITPLDIADATCSTIPEQMFTGTAVEFDWDNDKELTYPLGGVPTKLRWNTDFTVSYSNNVKSGTATITFTGIGNYTGTKTVTFEIGQVSLAPSNTLITTQNITAQTFTGCQITPSNFKVYYQSKSPQTLASGTDYTITYGENINVGTNVGTVTYTGKGSYKDSRTVTFTIQKADIRNITYTLDKTEYPYTGEPIKPVVTAKFGKCNYTLVEGVDYSVSYSNNVDRGQGIITLTALSGGNFKNTTSIPFQIGAMKVVECTYEPIPAVTYDGQEHTTADDVVLVVKNGDDVLVEGTDYILAYSNHINRGTATVTVTGVNNFTGTKTLNFTINPYDISGSYVQIDEIESSKFAGVPVTPSPNVFFRNGTADYNMDEGTDYEIEYSSNMYVTDSPVATFKAVDSETCNFTGSRDVPFSITCADMKDVTVTGINAKYTYTGSQITPEGFTLKMGSYTVDPSEYTVTYGTNVAYGTNNGKVYIAANEGAGNFCGQKTVSFSIIKRSIEDAVVTGVQDKVYTGVAAVQNMSEIVVTLDGQVLTQGTDYTIAYAKTKRTNVGDPAAIVVSGAGNYSGKLNVSFNILPLDLSSPDITVAAIDDKEYTGSQIKPAPVLTYGERKITNTNYTTTYSDNVNVGVATITLTAKTANYTGTRTVNFNITPVDIDKSDVVGLAAYYTYTGSQITPSISDKYKGYAQDASSYSVTYGENTNVGATSGVITLTANGTGNFIEGTTKTVTFEIRAVSLKPFSIADRRYTGEQIRPTAFSGKFTSGGKQFTVNEGIDFVITGYRNNVNVGEAIIDIRGIGNYTGTTTVTFNITKSQLTATLPWTSRTYNGAVQLPEPVVTDKATGKALTKGTDYTLDYSNASSTNVGTYTVNVVGTGNYSGNSKLTYNITPATLTASLDEGSFLYDFTEHTVTVSAYYEGTANAVSASDYTVNGVTSAMNANEDPGYKVTVTPGSNFAGQEPIELTWYIMRADIINAEVPEIQDQTYTCEQIRPEVGGVTYTHHLTPVLVREDIEVGNDFTLEYGENVAVGTGSITLHGIGNYKNTKIVYFNIVPAPLTATLTTETFNYHKGIVNDPGLVVTGACTTAVEGRDYEIVTGSTRAAENVGDYFITVRPMGNYTGDDIKLTWKVQAVELTAEYSEVSNVTYDCLAHGQQPTVSIEGLTQGTDYTVAYTYKRGASATTDLTKVGEITVTTKVTMLNSNYTVSPLTNEQTYEIQSASLTAAIATDEFTYDGSEKNPGLTVTSGATCPLTEGVDYEISAASVRKATAVGDYEIVVTPKGNYTGAAQTLSWSIKPGTVTASVEYKSGLASYISATSVYYTGAVQHPTVSMTGPKTLVEGTDYTVTWNSDFKTIGTHTVTVTLSGNLQYADQSTEKTFTFEIVKRTLTASVSNMAGDCFVYDGTEKTPTVTVKDAANTSKTLVLWTDYGYDGAISATLATSHNIRVYGMGIYAGCDDINLTWCIGKGEMTATITPDEVTYDGTAHTPTYTVRDKKTGVELKLDDDFTAGGDFTRTDVGNYTITITAAEGGNYSGTIELHWAIKASALTAELVPAADQTYDGIEKSVEVVVKDANAPSKIMTRGTDYTVEGIESAILPDTYTVTVTPAGNYAGEPIVLTWKIARGGLTASLAPPTTYTYDGTEHAPTLVVSDANNSSREMVRGTDYTIKSGSVESASEADTYTITVVPAGYYAGGDEIVLTWKIEQSTLTARLDPDEYTYDATAKTPSIIVEDATSSAVLTEGADYDVDGTRTATDYGTYNITVTPKGNYKGAPVVLTWNINKSELIATVDPLSFTYDGTIKTPTVSVTDKTTGESVASTEYTIAGETSGTNVKTYTITVTPKGNYKGTAQTLTWSIAQATLTASVEPTEFLYDGTKKTPTVKVEDAATHNELVAGTDYTISGQTNGTANGTYTITVTPKGNYGGAAQTLTWKINKSQLLAEVDPTGYTFDNTTKTPNVIVTDKTSGKTLTADVDYEVGGEVSGKNNGTYTITVTPIGNYEGDEIALTWSIGKAAITASLDPASYTYDASEKEPSIIVKDASTGRALSEGTDYTVDGDRKGTDNGTYNITVTPAGNYAGDPIALTWSIGKAGITASLTPTSYTYDASEKEPSIVVKDASTGRTLAEGTDYTVSGARKGTENGTYSITITPAGNYDGEPIALTWSITKSAIVASLDPTSYTYDASEKEPSIIVKDASTDRALAEGTDYTVSGARKGTENGTYSITITPAGNYDGEPIALTWSITKSAIVASLDENSYLYDATEKAPVVTVKDKNTDDVLSEGTDYTISGTTKETNNGTYTIIVTPAGNYDGDAISLTWVINKSELVAVLDPATFVYDGDVKTPAVVVTDKTSGRTLTLGTDYTVGGETSGTNVNSYDITVTPKGNYKGTAQTLTWTITKSTLIASVDPTEFLYDGTKKTPTVKAEDASTHNELVAGTDYTVSGQVDGTANGTYTITVTPKGNYGGTAQTLTWVINKSELVATVTPGEYTYDCTTKTPTVVVTDKTSGKTLTVDVDYEVSGEVSGKNYGTYTITVTPAGNYEGTAQTLTWTINKAELTAALTTSTFTYDGSVKDPGLTVSGACGEAVEGTDYTVSAASVRTATNHGEYTIVVTPMGNYDGEAQTLTWEISKSTLTASLDPTSVTYDAAAHTPVVTVKDATTGAVLTVDVDYTLSGDLTKTDNGSYTITVTGINNYEGSNASLTWTITKAAIIASIEPKTFTYDATEKSPVLTVKDAKTDRVLERGTDYTVSGTVSETANGTYTIVVTPAGNYTGEAQELTWTITKAAIIASIEPKTFTYDASEKSPVLTVKDASTDRV
ncbi:MAG: hypothetical protein II951_06615, partial [Bacteroidales bacterium]|nr:hypothetical protein [Bacteroidales bacterium]